MQIMFLSLGPGMKIVFFLTKKIFYESRFNCLSFNVDSFPQSGTLPTSRGTIRETQFLSYLLATEQLQTKKLLKNFSRSGQDKLF